MSWCWYWEVGNWMLNQRRRNELAEDEILYGRWNRLPCFSDHDGGQSMGRQIHNKHYTLERTC